MSWEPYVQSLVEGGFYHGCIAGHNGQIWGASPNFKVLPKEIVHLAAALSTSDDTGALRSVQQKGFTVQGRAYALNRFEDGDDDISFLVGRCKQNGSAVRGVVVARTAQTVIIGVHDPIFAEGISFGKSSVAMFQLAESLVSMNF